MDMENDNEFYDECEYKFESLKTSMEIFYNVFNKYMNINLDYNSNTYTVTDAHEINKSNRNLISESENQIILIRAGLNKKFEIICSEFSLNNKCKNISHKNIPNDIQILKNTMLRLIEMYEKKKEQNKKKIEILLVSDSYISTSNSLNGEDGFHKGESDFSIQNHSYQIYDEYLENTANSKFQEQIEKSNMREYNGDKEAYQKIIGLKNQIAELTNTIQKENIKASHSLIEIEENVDQCDTNLEKSNDRLRQAALFKNKANTIKYPLSIAAILGAAGTIVPGIGNIIGVTVGTGIGYAIAKLEKRAIKKIEPDKYSQDK